MKPKLIRITTIPLSLDKLIEGQLKFMRDEFDITAISSNDNGYLKKVAEREGVKYYPIELTRSITPIQDIKSLYKLYKFLKKEKPEIVHSHTPKAGTIGMWAAYLASVPVRLHTVAGLPLMEAKGTKRIVLNAVEKLTYKAANFILPNSFGLKEIILSQKFTNENKLQVLGNGSSNGIDIDYFNPDSISQKQIQSIQTKFNIQPDDHVIVFVGRIVKDKGIEELVTAFEQISHPKTKLLLVGKMEEELDSLTHEINEAIQSNPKIIITGWQTDVRPFYAISDFLAFPSYREGFPNVVLQAGAMGLPSIVSNINGCNEIITHNYNGLIVPPKNVDQLLDAIKTLLEDTNRFNALKANARKTIEENYTRDVVWKALKEFYFEILHK